MSQFTFAQDNTLADQPMAGPFFFSHTNMKRLNSSVLTAPFTTNEKHVFPSRSSLKLSENVSLCGVNRPGLWPVVGLLKTLDAQLGAARENLRGGSEQLQQLCLIIADGRFHEKEALRRQMREMGSRRGLLVAFIVLDNPQSSMLDMQSVSFTTGKPVFTKYLDTFPFPYYTLVQDINRLPAVISDLLRQWFEITASGA